MCHKQETPKTEVPFSPTQIKGYPLVSIFFRVRFLLFSFSHQPEKGFATLPEEARKRVLPSAGVIILTVSAGYPSQRMGLFPFNPALNGGDFGHGKIIRTPGVGWL